MITRWKVSNFKSVRKQTDITMAPLTLFAGANSSGKSTLLQSILLVTQTLSNKVSSRSVVLNGALTKLGQFDDLRSADSSQSQIEIGWTCAPLSEIADDGSIVGVRRPPAVYTSETSIISVSCEFAFDAHGASTQHDITPLQPRLASSHISVSMQSNVGTPQESSIDVQRATTPEAERKQALLNAHLANDAMALNSLQYEVTIDEFSATEIHEELVSAVASGCTLRHFLPERLLLRVDIIPEITRLIVNTLTGDGPLPRHTTRRLLNTRDPVVPEAVLRYIESCVSHNVELRNAWRNVMSVPSLFPEGGMSLDLFFDGIRKIPVKYRMELRRRLSEDESFSNFVLDAIKREVDNGSEFFYFRNPTAVGEACWYLDQFFTTSVRYLGPLRDEPKALYPVSPAADPSDVGLKGEYTASVMELYKHRTIKYIPTAAFLCSGDVVGDPVAASLEAAVIDWLKYLGVAESVRSRDRANIGHELGVRIGDGKRFHDLTHVGVGVSQVLPILVASLLAEPDTSLVFEQPEIHLHPRVQTLLGDFFLSMTRLGKQCIIETHSEYLVNRIRFRTAAAPDAKPWLDAVKVYFVERDSGGSSFRDVKINEFGAIPDWPDGFFDETQRESEEILRAASRKRKSRKEK